MRLTRRTWLAGGAAALAAAADTAGAQGSAPPNIVFLISDDHSYPDLGCYGNPTIRTPNLDRLARDGMRFDHCYVASPQCSPNRSAIFTGCSPHTTSTSRLHTPMPDWEPSFLEPLKERGYFTGAFRKVHQGPSFEKRLDFYGGTKVPFARFFDAVPKGKPFFLHFGSTDPHRPYGPGAIDPPHDPAKVPVPPYLPDTPAVRQDLAYYYDEIARFDFECGQILSLLEERGLAENTLVVMTGDNGLPFPRAKGACYDPGLRVPLLARWPGRIAPGSVAGDLISHVDLAPTWIAAAGLSIPEKMQGRSFLPRLLGQAFEPREAIFAERNWHDNFDPIRAVRTRRHKLIFNAASKYPYRPSWDLEDSPTWQEIVRLGRTGGLTPPQQRMLDVSRPEWELYDLDTDPNEFHNLATDPASAEVFRAMQRRLSDWMHETYDYLPPLYRSYPARDESPGRTSL